MPAPVATLISADPYLRERLEPAPGDSMYLHLSDLKLAMASVEDSRPLDLLDFGCGGSPYRSLFPNAHYKRADLPGTEGIDYEIKPGNAFEPLPVESASFDLVLSSQVLEHVPDPDAYLREARRLLRPGGRMIITTHGIFEDHGCPYDFQRWTDAGLARDLTRNHFEIDEVWKLTTGTRAALFLLEQAFPKVRARTLFGACLWPLRYAMLKRRAWWHRGCDTAFSTNRFVKADLAKHRLYIGLGFVVRAV
ncbi:class I SAM-dependent methyltransferase [Prosthecobacter sp.]|uniref:class I SAM-dependent methyltransferase n=1 Tax=Prosthecobacter sp. TaxID=1965333 RepID=UPI003783A61A